MNEQKGNGQDAHTAMAEPLAYGRPGLAPRHRHSIWPWVIFIVALLLLLGGVWYFVRNAQSQPTTGGRKGAAGGDIPVIATKARKGDMIVYLDGLGLVQAYNTVTIHTRVDGQLLEVNFKEGQLVKEGDILAEIDPAPYQATLDAANGQWAKDKAMLAGAENDLKIDQSVTAAAMPKQTLEDQEALVAQLKGTVEADAAQVESANVNLKYCTIRAPFPGKMGIRLIDKGNIVHAADTTGIAVLTQLQPIAVDFSLPEDDLPEIMKQYNTGRTIVVDALDRSLQNALAKGEVLAIDNEIDPTTGSIKIKAKFNNEDNVLVPSQFVNARLELNTIRGAVIVPAAAVQHTSDNSFVFVVKVDADKSGDGGDKKPPTIKGSVQMRTVQVGQAENDQVVIDEGLSEGEIVVTDGVDKLLDNSKVTVKMIDNTVPGAATQPSGTTRPSHGGRGGARGDKSGAATQPSHSAQMP